MAAIAVQPFVLKDALFTVDADEYQAHVSSVVFTPASSAVTWIGLTPSSSFSDASSPTWSCAVGYAQDWTTTNSFARYLHDHQGETKAVVFAPLGGDGPSFEAELIINAGPIGGEVNTVQVGTVTLGVVGAPEYVAAA